MTRLELRRDAESILQGGRSMRINTNISALNAWKNLSVTDNLMAKSLEKLSRVTVLTEPLMTQPAWPSLRR